MYGRAEADTAITLPAVSPCEDRLRLVNKATREAQPPRPFRGEHILGFLRPFKSKLCRDGGVLALHERDKIEQSDPGVIQLESQAAPHLEIISKAHPQSGHRTPPGQAKARVCSEARSTFA